MFGSRGTSRIFERVFERGGGMCTRTPIPPFSETTLTPYHAILALRA